MNDATLDKNTTLFNLREIFSLLEKNQSLLESIDKESSRLDKVNQLIHRRANDKKEFIIQLEEKQENSQKINNQYNKLTEAIEESLSKKNQIISEKELEAFEKTLKSKQEEQQSLESQLYNLLEGIEEIEQELKEIDEFEKNIHQTKSEIQEEVNQESQNYQIQLKQNEERIEFLKSNLSDLFQVKINKIIQKKMKSPLVSQLTAQNKCMVCQFQLNSQSATEIDQLKSLFSCSSCSRIILPLES